MVSSPAAGASPRRDAVFISYRRDDARGASGRVYDWLKIGFGAEAVFRDVHSIGVGRWRDRIDAALARCAACVAVIGPRWADATNLPRLQQDDDMVRHELCTALADPAILLVPLLVENTTLPGGLVERLPQPLQPLFRDWNIRAVTEDGWEGDIRRLIQEIGAATGLPVQPDFPSLLASVAAAEQRLAVLEQEHQLRIEQLEASQATITELRSRLAAAGEGERDRLAQAFAALARGDTRQAEAAFEEEHGVALRRAVETACHVANLAALRDVEKAHRYLHRAIQLDPQEPKANLQLAQALLSLGDLDGAEEAFGRGLNLAAARGLLFLETSARLGLAECAQQRGDGRKALRRLQEAQQLAAALARRPRADDAAGRRALAVTQVKLGDALLALGRSTDALTSYELALELRQALAREEPQDLQAQRDWASSLERIAEIRLHQRDSAAALPLCRQSLALRQGLVGRDPARLPWRRDLAIGHGQLGDALMAGGDRAEALESYRQGREIMETLVAIDEANARWQRGLAVAHNRCGEVLLELGRSTEALTAFRQALAIAGKLAALDPDNGQWQADLAISCDRLAELLLQQGDPTAALGQFRQALDIRRALVERSPEGSPWLRDLFVSQLNVAESLDALGEAAAAEASARQALATADQLLERNPADPQARFDRTEAAAKLLALLGADPDGDEKERRELRDSARHTIAELRDAGWPLPEEAWLQALERD